MQSNKIRLILRQCISSADTKYHPQRYGEVIVNDETRRVRETFYVMFKVPLTLNWTKCKLVGSGGTVDLEAVSKHPPPKLE
jgi:hypothetical protein